jgi:hypothetical protein
LAWSECTKEQFSAAYFNKLWHWLLFEGGNEHVAAYLVQRDLSAFDPCALPRQTSAFFDIVNASVAPEDAELADVLDDMERDEHGQPKRPGVCSLLSILTSPNGAALEWLLDRRHRRSIPHRMERCGYIACRNPNTDDGLWRINGRRQTLYVKANLTPEQRLQAARDYVCARKRQLAAADEVARAVCIGSKKAGKPREGLRTSFVGRFGDGDQMQSHVSCGANWLVKQNTSGSTPALSLARLSVKEAKELREELA